ncbi:hypothetical protein [uncultured Tateyamaria sp.]|uniref:hypothetical protein n=1 Tax=uncultured Tateyamaria sp. TaxID=455651 RepID=UPI002633FFBA|nr:hypothetical protein [uncultured Tateyamaria sp.]
MDLTTTAGLWLAVILSGLYHGLNPGMGWPLAVSSALFERKRSALWPALGALSLGHFAAMLGILLPFSLMTLLIDYEREIRIGAGLVVITMGLYLAITRKHPRFLARIPPHKLTLWSFLVALAHGAALMLVPIYLGLCAIEELDAGHRAASALMATTALALGVAVLHTVAMMGSGGAVAYAVHRWLGLQFLSRSWFDLELVWALSLIVVGGVGLWTAV